MTSPIDPFVVADRHYSLDQVEGILAEWDRGAMPKSHQAPLVPEAAFLGSVIHLCHLLRLTVYHTHDSRRSQSGFPDLVIIGPDRPILFVECKAPWGRLTPGQRAWFRVALRSSTPVWLAVVRPQDWPALERVLKGDLP